MKIPREILHVARGALSDDMHVRFQLTKVELAEHEDGWQVSATDGRFLVSARTGSGRETKRRLVDASLIRTCVPEGAHAVHVDLNDDEAVFRGRGIGVSLEVEDCPFPNIGKMVSDYSAGVLGFEFGVDAQRLGRAMSILAAMAPHRPVLVSGGRGPDDVLLFRAQREDGISVTVALMPMFLPHVKDAVRGHQPPAPREGSAEKASSS